MNSSIKDLEALLFTIKKLREPDGCPWDREQTHESLKKYLIEECYEVLDAIDKKSEVDLREELGDLLFQICIHSQISHEKNYFDFYDICKDVNLKMISRHPHVFETEKILNSSQVVDQWEELKKHEKIKKGKEKESPFESIPKTLPSLSRAVKTLKKIEKLNLKEKLEKYLKNHEKFLVKDVIIDEDSLGNFLLVLANHCKELKLDPEESLRKTINKLQSSFEEKINHE